ncbi:hypothetical protein P9112_003537 [Eukaryota sp. TZLM1-RC]
MSSSLLSKQYIYQLALSQLINDGHTAAAESLANSLELPHDPSIPSNRLETIVQKGLSSEYSQGQFDPHISSLPPDVDIPDDTTIIMEQPPSFPLYDDRYHSPHKSCCRCVAFSPDGKWCSSGSADTSVKLIDLSKARSRSRESSSHTVSSSNPVVKTFFGHSDFINTLSFHPFAPFLASGGRDGIVSLFDVARNLGGKNSFATSSLGHNVRSISWLPSGDWIIAGTESPVLKFLNVSTDANFKIFGQRESNNNDDYGAILSVDVNPITSAITVGTADHYCKSFDIRSLSQTSSIKFDSKVADVTSSQGGNYLAITTMLGSLLLIDSRMVADGKRLKTIDIGATLHRPSVSWLPKAENLVVSNGNSNNLTLVNTVTGTSSEIVTGHQGPVRDVKVSQEGAIASASEDKRVRLYFESGL